MNEQPNPTNSVSVSSNGKVVFSVTVDGRLVLGEGASQDEGTQALLQALAQRVPTFVSTAIALFCRNVKPSPITQALVRGAVGGTCTAELADRIFLAVGEQLALAAEEAGLAVAKMHRRVAEESPTSPSSNGTQPILQ